MVIPLYRGMHEGSFAFLWHQIFNFGIAALGDEIHVMNGQNRVQWNNHK